LHAEPFLDAFFCGAQANRFKTFGLKPLAVVSASRGRSQASCRRRQIALTHCRESELKTVGHGSIQSKIAIFTYFQPLRKRYRWYLKRNQR
jgi:hypothetical protein